MVKPWTSDHARVMAAACSSDSACSEIGSWRLAPIAPANPANEAYPDHISTRSYDRPGWVYVGYYNSAGQRFNDEIVAVRLDGQAVERLAHKHSAFSGCSRCESHGVPSRDGLRVLFASNWALNGDGTSSVIQAYVVDTRSLR